MTATPWPAVVDLRQYTLRQGERDTLIELFDTYLLDAQEAVGIHVLGQFRDLDDPDRFVWLRSFDSMAARGEALPRFYYGPVWRSYRERANATMLDSDDALLIEPLRLGTGFPHRDGVRPAGPTASVVAVTVAHLDRVVTDADRELAERARRELAGTGADIVGVFATHQAENNFPTQPLRDDDVLVWITRFTDEAEHRRHRDRLAASAEWRDITNRLAEHAAELPMQQLRLGPTDRSRMR